MSAEIKDKGDPESVKEFAYEICQEYLAGVWKSIPIDQFEITKLT